MDIKSYISKHFNKSDLSPSVSCVSSSVHLRFELGLGFDNGTLERVNQGVARAAVLFEELFQPDDLIWLLIKSSQSREDAKEFFAPTSGYLEKQFEHFDAIEKRVYQETIEDFCETVDANNQPVMTDFTRIHSQQFFCQKVSNINYQNIFRGVANLEMGLEPAIGDIIYFVNPRNHIAFYVYDDRGCILYAAEKDTLRSLYIKYNHWLVDYHRATFDRLFS